MATLDMDMRTTMTMMTTMTIMNLARSPEICLPAVKSRGWQFRILLGETILER
jgi:hypothetical protein